MVSGDTTCLLYTSIQAIGDSSVLEAALKMRGGVVDNLGLWGIEVKIKVEEEVVLPAYSLSLIHIFFLSVGSRSHLGGGHSSCSEYGRVYRCSTHYRDNLAFHKLWRLIIAYVAQQCRYTFECFQIYG